MSDIDLESGGKVDGDLCYMVEIFSKIITCNAFGGRL